MHGPRLAPLNRRFVHLGRYLPVVTISRRLKHVAVSSCLFDVTYAVHGNVEVLVVCGMSSTTEASTRGPKMTRSPQSYVVGCHKSSSL